MTYGEKLPLRTVLITIFLLLLLPVSYSHHKTVKNPTFKEFINEKFNHIVVHNTTGRVYVGAVNRIYQLTEDLNLEAIAVMGPLDDSPNCPVTRVCPKESKVPTDYHNKALLIYSSQNKLLACGSLFQGVCTLHDLDDVSVFKIAANESVVANNGPASTVAFTAPSPATSDQPLVLFVGVSFTGSGPYISDVPAVSSRSLDPSNMLAVFKIQQTTGTKIFVNSLFREIYPITYVYGFSSEGFSYFITVQKESSSSETSSGPFISKLVRICQNDTDYYSYTEVPLSCRAPDGTVYNLAQAAYVGKSGHELAKSLGIPREDELFVVFAKSNNEDNVPSQNSALCVYYMSDVRRMFTQNIRHCYEGNGQTGLEFIIPSMPCLRVLYKVEDNFCGLDVNIPLGGTIPIEAVPVLTYPEVLLTAVTATSTAFSTVLFLGTSDGHLKKAIFEIGGSVSEHSDVVIEEGSPVNPDLAFDQTKDNIYVMTQNMVTKVKVHDCEMFHTCSECLEAKIPDCGWCSSENNCLSRKACAESHHDSFCWFSHNDNQCSAFTEHTGITAESTDRSSSPHGPPRSPGTETSKLTALQDIAQSMRHIVKLLGELIDLQKPQT